MATVQSIKASGGDYTSIQAWYDAHSGDITSDADAPYIGELYAEEYASATLTGSTTDATHYFHLRAVAGSEFRGDFDAGDFPKIKAKFVADDNYTLLEHFMVIQGDSFEYFMFDIIGSASKGIIVDGCGSGKVSGTVSGGAGIYGLRLATTNGGVFCEIRNCCIGDMVVDQTSSKDLVLGGIITVGEVKILNCSVSGLTATKSGSGDASTRGIIMSGADGHIRNCVVCGNSSATNNTDFEENQAGGTFSNNASEDATALGANSITSIVTANQFVDVTPATLDFHIKNTDADIYDAGVDLSGTFTKDIDDETRSRWDIGVDEFTSDGTDVTVLPSVQSLTSSLEAPTVVLISNPTIIPSVLALTVTLETPTVYIENSITVQPSIQTISAILYSPVIVIGQTVQPTAQSLVLTLQTPTVDIISSVTATPSVLELTSSLLSPTIGIDVIPTVQELTNTLQTSVIDIISNVTVTPSTLGLTNVLYSPLISASITPTVLELTSSLLTTTVDVEINVTVSPAAQSLNIAQYTPTISMSDDVTVQPSTQTLTSTLQAPTLDLITNVLVAPNVLELISSLLSSNVAVSDITVAEVQNISLIVYAPTISIVASGTIVPPVQELTASLLSPDTYIEESITATPDAQTLSTTLYNPTLQTVDTETPDTFELAVTLESSTIVIVESNIVLPDVFATTLTLQSATVYIQSDVVILPSVFQTTSTLHESGVVGTANISVDLLTMTMTFEDIVPQSKVLPDTFTFNVTQYAPQLHWTGVVNVAVLTINTELGDITVELDFVKRTVRIIQSTVNNYLGMKTLALRPDNKTKFVASDNSTQIL